MKKGKFVSLISLVLVVLLLVSCGSTSTTNPATSSSAVSKTDSTKTDNAASQTNSSKPAKKQLKVVMTVGIIGHSFIARVWKSAEARLKELGVQVTVLDDNNLDTAAEAANVDQIIATKPDAVLMHPVGAESSTANAKKIMDAGIPLVTFLDAISQKDVTYVGSNFVQGAGAGLTTEKLVEKMGGKGNLVYIRGSAGTDSERNRDKAFRDVMSKNPDIKIVFEQHGKWDRSTGEKIMSDALIKLPKKGEINAVFAHNDEMALGALQAIKNANRLQDPIWIFGIDGAPQYLEAVKSGETIMTAFQNAEAMGTKAGEAAFRAAKGEKLPSRIDIPWETVTSDTVSQFLERWDASKNMFKIPDSYKDLNLK